MSSVRHIGAVAVPQQTAQAHIALQGGGGAEVMAFCGGGGKGGDLEGVHRLWSHPQYGPVLRVPGESVIGCG